MVLLEVYSKNVEIKYKAFVLSKATFIALSGAIVSVILPFVLSYQTGGFWQKHDVFYEQPNVKFTGDFLFLATTNDNQKILTCSSFPSKYTNDSCFTIKVRESDENHDGKADSLEFSISAKLPDRLRVTYLYLILPLNYSLHSPCDFHMQSALIHQESLQNGASRVLLYADLDLIQAEPLECSKHRKGPIMNLFELQTSLLEDIIRQYAEMKTKTAMSNVLKTFNPINDGTFTISLALKYPEHKIYFRPRFWQILKFAWVQYLSLYIIVTWIVLQVKGYIFKNKLVLLYEDKSSISK